MWPAEAKPAKSPAASEAKSFEPKFDLSPPETAAVPSWKHRRCVQETSRAQSQS
jgi:hypothetical protein